MLYNKIFRKALKEVAEKYNLPEEVAIVAYRSFWEFTREKVQALPLSEDMTEDQFKQLRTSINIPSLGKLYVDYQRLLNIKRRREILLDLKHERT